MNKKMLGRLAATSLLLGIVTVGCTPSAQMSHPATLSDQAPKATEFASRAADKARAALAGHRGDAAVDAAEKAVSAQPNDSAYRLLLGQSYLAAGRFGSAETSFRDTLTLAPDQPKARFDLALAEIAQGHGTEAQAVLHGLGNGVAAADLGLALAMAGDRPGGIQILIDLIRSGKSDARGRQNLALGFALDGRWLEARGMAMQDTPADRINDQIAGWAEIARPDAGGPQQVAAMLGVRPASDPGLPSELALATPQPTPSAAPPVALAAADPAPVAAPIAAQVAIAAAPQVQPQPQPAQEPVTVPLGDPMPVVAPADAPAAMVALAAQQSPRASEITPPSLLRMSRFPMLRATPVRRSVVTPPPAMARAGSYVVQLGAYARADALQNAWSQASHLMPRTAAYEPTHAQFSFAGGSLVRLAVSGFTNRRDAVQLCEHVRARGGQCFVRAVAGDAPIQWVRRAETMQIASR